jgi:hypothetical protein
VDDTELSRAPSVASSSVAAALAEQARRSGRVPLPQLTDVDLCVFADLCAMPPRDEVWRRWQALPPADREALTGRSREFLEYRSLLHRVGGDLAPGYEVAPKLGFILTARLRPSFLALCCVPGQLRVGDLRLYGQHDEQLVLLEHSTARGVGPLGRIREYTLATRRTATAAAADWVRRSFAADPGAPRLVEVCRLPEGKPPTGERLATTSGPDGLELTHTRGDSVLAAGEVVDQLELAGRVAAALGAGPT